MIMLMEEDALSIEHLLINVRDKVGRGDRKFMRIQADILLKRLAIARRGYPKDGNSTKPDVDSHASQSQSSKG